jgi:hypothetical protein
VFPFTLLCIVGIDEKYILSLCVCVAMAVCPKLFIKRYLSSSIYQTLFIKRYLSNAV